MKKTLLLLILCGIFALPSKACVEQHEDSIWVSVIVDSLNCELMIQVANLQMMGGEPNEFCSCGINGSIDELGQLEYVVFVDATTLEPLIGFDQYELEALSGESWAEYDTESTYNWNGFISHVNEAGLVADQEVILWIKLSSTSDSWLWEEFEALCTDEEVIKDFFENFGTSIGTDMWNPEVDELSNDHLSISKLVDENNGWLHIVDYVGAIEQMDQMVEDFYNSVENYNPQLVPSLYPNPTQDLIEIRNLPLWTENISVYNSEGVLMKQYSAETEINLGELSDGLYNVVISGDDQRIVKRIIKKQ